MQYRAYNRLNLQYRDGGYVRDYSIDADYINSNNSTIDIVTATLANVGDIVCLIDERGAYDKGVVTSVDNEAMQITYKSAKELFNDNILNPMLKEFSADTDVKVAGRFGVSTIKDIMDLYWAKNTDRLKCLPMDFVIDGDVYLYNTDGSIAKEDGKPLLGMMWTWTETNIKFTDWLVELFEKYNVVVDWNIDFDEATKTISARAAKYVVTIKAVQNDNGIIKDNVSMQTITYKKEELPDATVCTVVDESGEFLIATGGTENTNLFDASYGYNDAVLMADDGSIKEVEYLSTIEGMEDQAGQQSIVSKYIVIDPTSDYYLSFEYGLDTYSRIIAFYKSTNEYLGYAEYTSAGTEGRVGYPITPSNIPAGTTKCRICLPKSAVNVQFEQGSTFTSYNYANTPAIYYLCDNNGVKYITLNKNDTNRMLPVRNKYITYDSDNATNTVYQAAYNELVPSKFNQAIEIEIPKETNMFEFEYAKYGDVYRIITKNGTTTSIYSGRKESSKSKMITLLFGYGRKNYTDIIQRSLRENAYTAVYK